MKKLALLLNVLIISSAAASDFPEGMKFFAPPSDSGIHGPAYKEIVGELQDLEKAYPEMAKVVTYGTSHKGRPLTLIKIAARNKGKTLPAIYIGGSIHGDEYLNIEDRLPRWFLEQSGDGGSVGLYLKNGGAIYIAPILNPDGYENRKRVNGAGEDLNRDYTVRQAGVVGLKQPETASLYQFLKEDLSRDNRRLEVAMDYHCCIGALLYPWSFYGPTLPQVDKDRHAIIGQIMQSSLGRDIKYGQTPVILGYSAKGTSKDFYYETFGARGFTYEGRRGVEDRYFNEHTVMWSEIVKLVADSSIPLQTHPLHKSIKELSRDLRPH